MTKSSLRSREWLDSPDLYGWLRRAALQSQGIDKQDLDGHPVIGICNSWSELAHCNAHLGHLSKAVKRGVSRAGGIPLEFPVMSLGEYNMRPTSMLYRNLMSMDVEESIRANPLDGVILLAGCDKTTPAMIMGAVSSGVPYIMVTGGPQLKANWRGQELGTCTDCRRYQQELRAGSITEDDWSDLQSAIISSPGHCGVMGTASTMAAIAEVLGIALPGNTDIPAANPKRAKLAEAAGRTIVERVVQNTQPSDFITGPALKNAIRVIHAMGGSTNAVIHLIAIAGRAGIELGLDLFDELSKTTPLLLDLKPSGQYLMEDFFEAGGLSALLKEISPLLDISTPTVTGKALGENILGSKISNNQVIRPLLDPVTQDAGLAVLNGSLAPTGAIIKQTAASPRLLRHRGRAIVFEDHDDLEQRIDSHELDVTPDDILVMKNSGPIGAPGMPEWGFIPIPQKLLQRGVKDMVRISDARMSGTAFGTVVVHVTPESAANGPLAAVQNGDIIELDVPGRRLDLLVDDREVERRIATPGESIKTFDRGYIQLFTNHVMQANKGCDFDFLRPF